MAPEFSRLVALDRIGTGAPTEVEVEATEPERRAVAARLMIPDVLALACRFLLWREPGRFVAEGDLRARVVQDCVVTLEPFAADMAERFRVHFVRAGDETEDDDPLAPDEIVFSGLALDVGEAAVEQLALALDPCPRRPGAALDFPEEGDAPQQPFAALRRLREE